MIDRKDDEMNVYKAIVTVLIYDLEMVVVRDGRDTAMMIYCAHPDWLRHGGGNIVGGRTVRHPQDKDNIIYNIGGLLVIENIQDKHQQQFLRGHDMEISAIAISNSG